MSRIVTNTNRARNIFHDALERYQPSEWPAFLDAACQGDDSLRLLVERLLIAHGEVKSFMGAPAAGPAATIDRPVAIESTGATIGSYKLLEQIGEGGMGVVFVAEQTEPVRRRVALKVIKPGMDTKQVIARFEVERQALAMMDHPNIARVLEAGMTNGRPYFVMELVRGMPITDYCDKVRLSPRQRLELFVDVCHAVQHAHQKGIIHRDLKPSNILVTLHDGIPVVKVIDFGVAKAIGQQLTDRTVYTALTQLVGTPLYMSPEQAELSGLDIDTRADVYSLGVLLYELLTGQTPFDKEALSKAGFDEMRRMIREDEPPRPSRRLSTLGAQAISTASQHRGVDERRLSRILSGELDWIVMKALEKDRSRRYESASALAADIQRYLSDEPVLACPPTAMYRFQKFARKHKPALFTAAAIAACLLLGTTVSAWQAVRATEAEAQARGAAAAEAQQRQRAEANEQTANTQRDEAQKQRDEVKALNEKLLTTQAELRSTLYAAHINLAQQIIKESDVNRVQELLAQHRPKPGEPDLRGFEWHYLNRLVHADLLTVKGHSGNIPGGRSVAFSPDGKRLAFTSGGWASAENRAGDVKVCDAQTGQELLVCKGHVHLVSSVAFSPDGKRLASSGLDGTVRVWDAQTGQDLITRDAHIGHSVLVVAFSPDGKRLATASGDKTVKVWDAQSGLELLTFKGHTGEVCGVSFSPDSKRLASASADMTVKVWDAQTGQELLTLKGHTDWVLSVAFSPDGDRLASSGEEVRVWDAQTGQELLVFKGHTIRQVNGVAFSPDAKRLASCGLDGTVKVWDAQTGHELFTFMHGGKVGSVVFSPDGSRMASGDFNGTVKVWDATTGPEARTFVGPTGGFGRVVFSPDGKRLAGASGENTLKVLDAQTGQELVVCKGHSDPIGSVAYSPDGKRLATGSGVGRAKSGDVKVWDAETGRELLTCKGHTAPVVSVAFSPDGKRLASSSSRPNSISPFGDEGEPGEVIVWDAETGQKLFSLEGHKRFVNSVVFSPNGKRLATLGRDNTKIWDAQTGKELLTLSARSAMGGSLAFSPDSQRLACSSGVWDAETGQELLTLRLGKNTRVTYTPDGRRLISSPTYIFEGKVQVWDARTGLELLSLAAGHAALSPDGHRLAKAVKGTVWIYDATPLPEKP